MFTGDRSGDWLFSALHEVGLANQPSSQSHDDDLRLNKIMVTAVCHCAPPDNKPTPIEITNCASFLNETFNLRPFRVYLCLGALAWHETLRQLSQPLSSKFSHGSRVTLDDGRIVIGSYHPSQQNTFTGRLTRPMLIQVVQEFADVVRLT